MGPETEDMWLAISSWKDPNQIYSRSERAKGTYSQERVMGVRDIISQNRDVNREKRYTSVSLSPKAQNFRVG